MKTPSDKVEWETINGLPLGVFFAAEVITYDPDSGWTPEQHSWFGEHVGKTVMGAWEEFQGGLAFRPVDSPVILYEEEIMPVAEMQHNVRLVKMVESLREVRLKQNVDYAYTFKYGKLRIMCNRHSEEIIVEHAEKFHLTIANMVTF